MRNQQLLFLVLLFAQLAYNQIATPLFFENFEAGVLPTGWTSSNAASSNGWQFGTSTALSSTSFRIPNVTGSIAATNDDSCGTPCNGTVDFLTSPPIIVNSVAGVFLRFRTFFTASFSQRAKIMISNSGNVGPFRVIASLTGVAGVWREVTFDLTNEIDPIVRNFAIRFWADDAGVWASGWAIDDVMIGVYDYTGVQPNCSGLVFPTSGGNTTYLPQTLSFSDPDNYPAFPVGYYINFGTNNPPTNIRNLLDISKNSSFTTPTLAPNTLYYWQVVPYGYGTVATGCPVWTFSTIIPSPPPRQIPYFENFEGGTGDWQAGGTSSSWAYGNFAKTVITGPYSGFYGWTTGGLGNTTYNSLENSFLVSPPFDFSTAQSELYINFKLWWNTENVYDGAVLQTSFNGNNWTTVGSFNDGFENWYDTQNVITLPQPRDGWSGVGPGGWVNVKHSLPGLAGSPASYLRFLFTSDSIIHRDGIAVDDIRIGTIPSTPPLCSLPSYPPNGDDHLAEKFNLEWRVSPAENPFSPVGYYLYLGSNQAANNILNAEDVGLQTSFTVTLDPATTYYWKVVPYGLAGVPAVNCPVWSFSVISPRTSFPYFQSFEDGEGGWAPLGSRSSWEFGSPNKSVIQGAASGTYCWVSGGLTGSYPNSEFSYVESPLFNFTNFAVDPLFSAKVWWQTENNYDGASLQIQFQGPNNNWTTIGTQADGDNWYTSNSIVSTPGGGGPGWSGRNADGSGGWVLASHILTGAAGRVFRLRFAFSSDGSIISDGFAFDDVEIKFPADLIPGCSSLVYPPNAAAGLNPPFNLQWTGDSSIPGLPVGYILRLGPTNPPTTFYDLQQSSSHPILNSALQPATTYYWKVVPYGYLNNTRNENCATWTFTTAAVIPPTSAIPTSASTAPSSVPTSSSRPQTSAQTTPTTTPTSQTSPPTSAQTNPQSSAQTNPQSSELTSEAPPSSSTPASTDQDTTGGSKSSGALVAAIVVPIVIVAAIGIAVGAFLYIRFSKKKKESLAKLDTIERELSEKEGNLKTTGDA